MRRRIVQNICIICIHHQLFYRRCCMLNLACDLCPSLGYILVEPVVFCVDPPYKSDAAMQYTSFLERRYFINNIYYLITGTVFWFLLFVHNSKQPNKNPSPHHASKNSPMFLKDTHTLTHTHTRCTFRSARVCVLLMQCFAVFSFWHVIVHQYRLHHTNTTPTLFSTVPQRGLLNGLERFV